MMFPASSTTGEAATMPAEEKEAVAGTTAGLTARVGAAAFAASATRANIQK